MNIKIFNINGNPVGNLDLDKGLWEGRVNTRLLNQAVAMYRSNTRAGTASTKTRANVSGGGKKPFKQKHTGRARAGSTRSPLWRHGGSVFGPRPHSFYFRLPQTMRRVALLESLKGKLQGEELVVLDTLSADAPKTKVFAGLAKAFKAVRRSIIVMHQPSDGLVKSLRNLNDFELCRSDNLNAFDVLNAKKVLVTKEAFSRLEQRLRGSDASSN